MDRHFVLQEEYIKSNTTGKLIEFLLQQYSSQMLDTWTISNQVPTTRTFKSDKGYIIKVIPVGYLEFIRESLLALDLQEKELMKPIEIPDILNKYLNRMYIPHIKGKELLKNSEYTNSKKYFVKNIDKLKSFNSILQLGDIGRFIEPESNYSVSEKIEIESEYRILVCKDEIIDIGFYNGNCLIFPDKDTIENMIDDYSKVNHPKGYTLDIAVSKDRGTVPIEIHPFVSCGIYTMCEDPRIIDMLEYGYDWYLGN